MAKPTKNDDLSDHDLLIRIDERVEQLKTSLANHVGRHWAVALLAISAFLVAVGRWILSSSGGG